MIHVRRLDEQQAPAEQRVLLLRQCKGAFLPRTRFALNKTPMERSGSGSEYMDRCVTGVFFMRATNGIVSHPTEGGNFIQN